MTYVKIKCLLTKKNFAGHMEKKFKEKSKKNDLKLKLFN